MQAFRIDRLDTKRPLVSDLILAAIFLLIFGTIFYREILFSNFDLVFGDSGDARLAMALMEHWRLVFVGQAPPLSPSFFYPTRGVLGYTDANFLYGIVFSVGRWLGLDQYGAFQLVVMSWGAIGYTSMFWLLKRVLGVRILISLLWASLFAFSNVNAIQVGHTQLMIAAMIPMIVGWAIIFYRRLAAKSASSAILPGLAMAALFPLMAFTGFYICWFFVLFVVTFAVVGSIIAFLSGRRAELRSLWDLVLQNWKLLASLVAVAAIFSLPFALTYGPQLLSGNSFVPDDLYRATFPKPVDLFNVGPENLIWGSLIDRLIPDVYQRPAAYELLMGIPPGIFLLFVFTTVLAFRPTMLRRSILPATLALTVIIGLVMMLNINGHSFWWTLRKVMPGASAIRVVSRYEVLLYFFLLLSSATVISTAIQSLHRLSPLSRLAIYIAFGCFLLLEQIRPTFAHLHKAEELARLNRIGPPPPICASFAVASPPPSTYAQMEGEARWAVVRRMLVDAILVAMRYGIPTINGLSSLGPREYRFVDVTSPTYIPEAGMWIARHHLDRGFCLLDLEKATWQRVLTDPSPLPTDVNILTSPAIQTFSGAMRLTSTGFSGGLPQMWTGPISKFTFTPPPREVVAKIAFYLNNPIGSDITLKIDDQIIRQGHFPPGSHQIISPAFKEINVIEIQNTWFRPSDIMDSIDNRRLGVLITEVAFTPAAP